MKNVQQFIEQPAVLKVDDPTQIDTSLGITVGAGTALLFLALSLLKNIIACYQHYSRMLANIEKNSAILADMKHEHSEDFTAIKQQVKELQMSILATQSKLLVIEKSLEEHMYKIANLESSNHRILRKLGDP